MSELNNASVNAGSAEELIKLDPSDLNSGGESIESTGNDTSALEQQKRELEQKLGTQGSELGDLRNFFKDIEPLLDRLQENPEVVDAILSGKINSELVANINEGKVTVGEATQVVEAHEEVKKELGQKGYEKMSPEDIAKMVSDKVREETSEIKSSMQKERERQEFISGINDFIKETPDLEEYAEDIDEYLRETKTYDIKAAYWAVKGMKLDAEKRKGQEAQEAEAAKQVALNATGGSSSSVRISQEDKQAIDALIGGKSSPNSL